MKEFTAKSVSRKDVDSFYSESFEDMESRTVYHDPFGTRTSKGGFSLKPQFYQKDKEWYKVFNKVQKEYNPPTLRKAIELTNEEMRDVEAKANTNLATNKWNIPIWYLPDVTVADPEKTPMADMLARETIDSDKINVTRQQNAPSPQTPLEDNDYTSVDYDSTTYFSDKQYDIYGYGLKSEIEDAMLLASRSLRSPENEVERLHAKGIREFEEAQILYGTTDYSAGYTRNDTSSFSGFDNIGSSFKTKDVSSLNPKDDLRELIDEVEFKGADSSNIGIVTSFKVHRKIRNALSDYTRYEVQGDELGFGYRTLEFDGVPIMKSHAIPDSPENSQPYVFGVDMGVSFMGMLQDMTVKPLAKTKPREQMATDAYGALAVEAPSHIQYIKATS